MLTLRVRSPAGAALDMSLNEFAEQLRPYGDPTTLMREIAEEGPDQMVHARLPDGTMVEICTLLVPDHQPPSSTQESRAGLVNDWGRGPDQATGYRRAGDADETGLDSGTADESTAGGALETFLGVMGVGAILLACLAPADDSSKPQNAIGAGAAGPGMLLGSLPGLKSWTSLVRTR